jgi:hypothetical protein
MALLSLSRVEMALLSLSRVEMALLLLSRDEMTFLLLSRDEVTLLLLSREFRLGEGEDVGPCACSVVDELVVWALHFCQRSDGVGRLNGEGMVGCLDVDQEHSRDIDGVVVGLQADFGSGQGGLFVDGYETGA